MVITKIIWKEQYIEKLADKHNISMTEVEEVLQTRPHIRKMGKGKIKGEEGD
jgi:hypothetical protein